MKWYIGLRSKQRHLLPPTPDRIVEQASIRTVLFDAMVWVGSLPELDQVRSLTITVERTDDADK